MHRPCPEQGTPVDVTGQPNTSHAGPAQGEAHVHRPVDVEHVPTPLQVATGPCAMPSPDTHDGPEAQEAAPEAELRCCAESAAAAAAQNNVRMGVGPHKRGAPLGLRKP